MVCMTPNIFYTTSNERISIMASCAAIGSRLHGLEEGDMRRDLQEVKQYR